MREGRRRADVRYVARSLLKYAKPYLPLFFLVFFASLAGTVLSLLGPQVCGYAINEIKPDGGTDFAAIGAGTPPCLWACMRLRAFFPISRRSG